MKLSNKNAVKQLRVLMKNRLYFLENFPILSSYSAASSLRPIDNKPKEDQKPEASPQADGASLSGEGYFSASVIYALLNSSIKNSINLQSTLVRDYDKYMSLLQERIKLYSKLKSSSNNQLEVVEKKDTSSTSLEPSVIVNQTKKISLKDTRPNNLVFQKKVLILNNSTELSVEERAIAICESIENASSNMIKSNQISDLFKHLYDYPDVRNVILTRKKSILKHLLRLRENAILKQDKLLYGNINQIFAMLGYIEASTIKNRGVNILSIDGGGSKGFVAIEVLKNIERQCNKPIHEIFDYICGVSTGAILASLIGVYKLSLDECERQYKIFIKEIFHRSKAAGISNLLLSYGYYDTKIWESMLKDAMGETLLINSAKDIRSCKISLVANVTTPQQMKVFLFRNYNLPARSHSHYDGTTRHKIWEAVRASSAAPGYYEDFKIDGYVFHDGGILANNPTAIALHEAKQLWPKQPINCIVSIGNGRYQPAGYTSSKAESISLKQKINRVVGGISCTENIHTMLLDLLPAKKYFRFNPYMSEEFHLDEDRPLKWKLMQYESTMYMRRNDAKFKLAAKTLLTPKTPLQNLEEFITHKIKLF